LLDLVWAIGGRWCGVGEAAAVEIFRPESGDWAEGLALMTPRGGFAAAVVDGRIVVAGGEVIFTGRVALRSVEILDPRESAWMMDPGLPSPSTACLPD
jgi:hypothetical protein